jgi:hypothetical protein
MHVFTNFDQARAAANSRLGTSAWMQITQEQIDRFTAATGNHHGSTRIQNAPQPVSPMRPLPTAI